MTAAQAFREFSTLKSVTAQYEWVKDQILIRYVGLGWEEAYHPWSKNGYVYTPTELLKHLTKVVIPLQRHKTVPEHPPMSLPTCPKLPTLGTRAADVVAMDEEYSKQSVQLRIDAYADRECLEEQGIGNQLSEMQQYSWKIFDPTKIDSEPFKIEMLFEYVEPGGELTYNWCQGVVINLVRQNDTCAVVEIQWNNDTAGGSSVTKEELKKSKWNPKKGEVSKKTGAWRQDLWDRIR